MDTRAIEFTPEQGAFIDRAVALGIYADAHALVRSAVARVERRDARRIERFHALIGEGIDAHDRGDYLELDREGLHAWFAEIVEETAR